MLLLPILAFLFVSLLIVAAAMAFAPANGGVIQQRLNELRGISGVPVDELTPAQRKTVTDHAVRSKDDAQDLVKQLETGELAR